MLSGRWSDFTKRYNARPAHSANYPRRQPVPVAGATTGSTVPRQVATTIQSPMLSNLKHSPYARLIPGFTGAERGDIYNRGREEIQGATETAMEQMREKMGGRGFRAGESGIADTILADIAKFGQKRQAEYSRDISIEDARKRFTESMALKQFGLQEQGAEHGEEMDFIQALLSLYGIGTQQQSTQWSPYWQGMTAGYLNL